jgi:hypothetical protein
MSDYPEHDKLSAIRNERQEIADFLEWLWGQGYYLARYHEHSNSCYDDDGDRVCGISSDELLIVNEPIHKLLAKYFDIDEERLEKENQTILERHNLAH